MLALATLLALAAAAQPAAATLLAISAEESRSEVVLHIETSAPTAIVPRYWIGSPNMLVLDFQGARSALPPGVAYKGTTVRVRVGQFQPRTARVVVEAVLPFSYSVTASQSGVAVRIRFPTVPAATGSPDGRRTSSAVPEGHKRPMEPQPSARPHALRNTEQTATAPRGPLTFSIVAFGTVETVAQTIAAITDVTIRVDPSVSSRPAVLNLPRATLQQALAELSRQTGVRWRTAPDGAIEIIP